MYWYLMLFISTFLEVFARAAQQLNVVHYKWERIPIISYLMAATKYVIVSFIAIQAYTEAAPLEAVFAIITMGTGGWIGAYAAMYLHRRMG